MQIHVSIHDVSPAFASEVEEALAWCHEVRVKPALLVVPNFHRAWPLQDFPPYIQRLQDLSKSGHEIYLHGYFHRCDEPSLESGQAPPRQSGLRRFFQQKVVSAGEAEFGALDRKEANARLQRGIDLFQKNHLPIDGFVAPAWTMPPWMIALLAEHYIAYTEDHFRIYNPRDRRQQASLVLNWASRSFARMASTVAFCRGAKHAARWLPTRVAIHPKDLRVPRLRQEIRRMLAWGEGHYLERAEGFWG